MKTRWIFQLTGMLLVSILIVSCTGDIVTGDTPGPIIINPPGNPDPEVPVSMDNQVKRITWSALDFKTFHYNSKGQLVKLYNQYNYVQGTSQVRQFAYDFTYDAAGRVSETKDIGGTRYVYAYENGIWKNASAYNALNQLIRNYEFDYNQARQLIASRSYLPGESSRPVSRASFRYDAAGNLTHFKRESYDQTTQSYTKDTEILFSAFDTQKYAPHAETFGEELLPISFWANNPGRKEFVNGGSPIEQYSYTYSEQGYPVSKTTRYIYSKPIPELRAVYTY